jgi:hypothetical protein
MTKRPAMRTQAKLYKAETQRLRSAGYHPSPKHGKGVWINRDNCLVADVEWNRKWKLWMVRYSISRKLLMQSAS